MNIVYTQINHIITIKYNVNIMRMCTTRLLFVFDISTKRTSFLLRINPIETIIYIYIIYKVKQCITDDSLTNYPKSNHIVIVYSLVKTHLDT